MELLEAGARMEGIDSAHSVQVVEKDRGELRAHCSCGATWSYKKGTTISEAVSIYESHLDYFKHKPMETL